MRIDNSQAGEWRFCPLKMYEKRLAQYPGAVQLGIEPAFGRENLDFGSRLHAMRHAYYQDRLNPDVDARNVPLTSEALEAEAQATWQAYLAHYPQEDFEIVETEQTRIVPLPMSGYGWSCAHCGNTSFEQYQEPFGLLCDECHVLGHARLVTWKIRHELVVKLDALIRRNGVLMVNDLKTEGRSSNNNDPESWAAKPQISLYAYAAKQLYPNERVSDEVLVDVIKRQSPKGQKGPEFFRDAPRRSERQIAEDLRDLVWVADQIEACERTGYWPSFKDNCKRGNWRCDFFSLHVNADEAREAILARNFRAAEPYLDLVQIEEVANGLR